MLNWTFIFYVGLIVFILLCGVLFFIRSQRQKTELRLIAAEFGTKVCVKAGMSSFNIEFERDGIVYKSSITIPKHGAAFVLNFYLPQFNEKFFIRQNSPFASLRAGVNESRFSQPVSVANLSDKYLIHSPNPDFSKELLTNKAILEEINSLDSVFNYPQIWFDDGHFQIRLVSTGWNLPGKFRHLCRAAISFHNGIKQLS